MTGYTEELQNKDDLPVGDRPNFIRFPYIYYDQCGFEADFEIEGETDKTSTGWTKAFNYNVHVYLILIITTVLMLVSVAVSGLPVFTITYTTGCAVCLGIPALAGAILSAVRLNSDLGTACSANNVNISTYDFEDPSKSSTFLDDGAALRLLFIMQLVFLCPMQCCALFGGGIGYVVMKAAIAPDDGYVKI